MTSYKSYISEHDYPVAYQQFDPDADSLSIISTFAHANHTEESNSTLGNEVPVVPRNDRDQERQDDPKFFKPGTRISCFKRNKKIIIPCVVILAAIMASIVLVLALMPKIAQQFINASNLSFSSLEISQASETGFQARIKGQITNAGPAPATTSPMQLSVIHSGAIIGSIYMPPMQISNGQADIDLDIPFQITNTEAFVEFNRRLLSDEYVVWRLTGILDLMIMSRISAEKLSFDKVVTLNGMNKFGAVEVNDFVMSGTNDLLTVNITTDLSNASPVSIEMGDLSFNMTYQGIVIGQVSSKNVTIHSGMNTLELSGSMIPAGQNQPTEYFGELFSKYLTGKDAMVSVIGTNIKSANPVPAWLRSTVEAINMDVKLLAPRNFKTIQNVSISGMSLDFGGSDFRTATMKAEQVQVGFQLPFEMPVKILYARKWFQVLHEGRAVGQVQTDQIVTNHAEGSSVIGLQLPITEMIITDESRFADLLQEMFLGNNSMFSIRGVANVTAQTPVGTVTLEGIPFAQDIPTIGMQALKVPAPQYPTNPMIHYTNVTKGYTDRIHMFNDITLYSASDMTVSMGNVILDLLVKDKVIGYTLLSNLTVAPGENKIRCDSYFKPAANAKEESMLMLNNFMNGDPTDVTMRGTSDKSSPNPILSQSMPFLDLTASLEGLGVKLVKSSQMRLNPLTAPFRKDARARFETSNPFGDSFSISMIDAVITYQGNQIATMNAATNDTGSLVTLAPNSETVTPYFPVAMDDPLGGDSLSALGESIRGDLNVSVNARIVGILGEYPIDVQYRDDQSVATIRFF